jgi:Mrp family chromosome partitioning ATPase
MMTADFQDQVERLYAQTIGRGTRVLAISAVLPGQGATVVAQSLALRHVLAGRSALIVDLNVASPSLIEVARFEPPPSESTRQSGLLGRSCELPVKNHELSIADGELAKGRCEWSDTPQLVTTKGSQAVFHGIMATTDRLSLVQLRDEHFLNERLKAWKLQYDTIIVDTTAILSSHVNTVPPGLVARLCEGCLLVLQSGGCTQVQIKEALDALAADRVNVLGLVMNDQFHPRLLSEFKRELNRLNVIAPRLAQWIKRKLDGIALLSMDI